MPAKILCVAEKPSIAKAVAGHLAGGQLRVENTKNTYIKNYKFQFDFGPPWGSSEVVMTAVLGHLTECNFGSEVQDWHNPPPEYLFQAPVQVNVAQDKLAIAGNIATQARHARALFIWTDCDREGEHIGHEIRTEAQKSNPRIQVKRARFSNIEKAHVVHAAKHLADLDNRQVDAVSVRIELDLRIGYAFTRFQTNVLRPLGGALAKQTISYGPCQFPTLGFVVDRYFKVMNFVPEPFWSIRVTHEREGKRAVFSWSRNRLFDRAIVTILYERCLATKEAQVSKIMEKATSKWKPLPLTTVEFQKNATRFLQMNSQRAMEIAEKLYNRGFISYPRTETDQFDRGMNLMALVEQQTVDNQWGAFAQNLVNGGFQWPRQGRNNDKAHPPIHPIIHVSHTVLDESERRVYQFVTRRFLACCSEDAKGQATDIEITYGDETFHTRGLVVLERNYLDVYPFENWTSSSHLPRFVLGERFSPTEALMTDGKTTAPRYLTEPDLLALMDANGIGTDATMAEHIAKIKERDYVQTRLQSARADDEQANARRPGNAIEEFIPTTLGVALVDGYDRMDFDVSLSKPFLRKEMEARMKAICEGHTTREAVKSESIRQYRQVFMESKERQDVLKAACRRYVINSQPSQRVIHRT